MYPSKLFTPTSKLVQIYDFIYDFKIFILKFKNFKIKSILINKK